MRFPRATIRVAMLMVMIAAVAWLAFLSTTGLSRSRAEYRRLAAHHVKEEQQERATLARAIQFKMNGIVNSDVLFLERLSRLRAEYHRNLGPGRIGRLLPQGTR